MHPYVGYGTTCRVCLKKDEQMKLTIFDMLNDTISYSDMLTMVLHPVPIDMNPILPQNLCQMCKDNLVKVFNLRQLCFTSDRWIKSTIYGDVYLNANGITLGGCPVPNDNSNIETMVIDSDDESPNPNLFLSSFQYSSTVLTPEILLQDNNEADLLVKDQFSAVEQPVKKPHSCQICRRKFLTIKGCLRHKEKKHKVIENIEPHTNEIEEVKEQQNPDQAIKDGHSCEICNRKFATLNGCLRHKVKHKDQYKCDLCSAAYNSSKGLKIHLASARHLQKMKDEIGPDRDYVCEKCCKGFTCIEEYSKHMLKHMVIRMDLNNLVCQQCGRWYSTVYGLKRHKIVNHTYGEK